MPIFVHEGVRCPCGQDGVGGDLHAAVGAVLEADRAAQAGSELAMALALGRARADRAPGDQVGDELRAQQVEELGAGGQAQRGEVEQQLARALEPFVDREAAVEVRVVDVALPADRGARLLEVRPHDDEQVVLQRVRRRLQPLAVLHRLVVVVDGARPHDDDEAVVAPVQHVGDGVAALLDQLERVVAHRHPFLQECRRDERPDGADAHVVDARGVEGAVADADLAVVAGVVDGIHGAIWH
jgi:hypothetical protein